MRTSKYEIKGINRYTNSPENESPFCSELINLKVNSGLKVTGCKEVVSANIPYSFVRVHRTNNQVNYIGIKNNAEGVSIVHFDPNSGDTIQQIASFDVGSDIYIEFLNQMLVISDKTDVKLYVYIFNEKYTQFFSGLDININYQLDKVFYTEWYRDNVGMADKSEFLAGAQAMINKCSTENPNYTEGYFLVAFNFTLWDGSEYGMYGLQCFSTDFRDNATPDGTNQFLRPEFIDTPGGENDTKFMKLTLQSNNFYQKFILFTPTISPSGYEDLISKVNMYVSKPISRFVLNTEKVNFKDIIFGANPDMFGDSGEITLVPTPLAESNIQSTLLYKQKSWTWKEFCEGINGYELTFGLDKITNGTTMEVTSSMIERAGKMYTYNNRIHFYDAKVRMKDFDITKSLYIYKTDENYKDYNCPVWVYLRINGEEKIIKYNDVIIRATAAGNDYEGYRMALPEMVIYPDSRAYKMLIGIWSTEYDSYLATELPLSSSPAYNYAYVFTGGAKDVNGDGLNFNESEGAVFDNTYIEKTSINVTSSGNPIYFPVEHSYQFDGNIDSICVAALPISEMQVGQYPLYVFTDNGTYALSQGSGAVLYGNILSINADKCTSGQAVYTRSGIAYISNDSVYILAGLKSIKLSMNLEGEIDTYIQNNDSFLKCCSNSLYNIEPYLSKVRFEQFVIGAKLIYNANTEELIVTNEKYPYSYIYNFISNNWHKQASSYEKIDNEYVLKPVGVNTQQATNAQGEVIFETIAKEKSKNFSYVCSSTFDTNVSCGPADKIALIIDGKQISSASFAQTSQMNLIMTSLCDKIGYLEDYKGSIYSNMNLEGKVAEVFNITSGTTMTMFAFTASSGSVTIPDKAIGTNVRVDIDNLTFIEKINEFDSITTILNRLCDKINQNKFDGFITGDAFQQKVTASVSANKLMITSIEKGEKTNSLKLATSADDPDYVYIKTSGMTLSGGKDISLQPSEYMEIIKWAEENTTQKQIIHLHTRPLALENPNGYKIIKKNILNLLAKLTGDDNLSIYTFASNNLIDWKCIAAAQRKNCEIAQITSNRTDKAYKYFIFMIGGIVSNNTQINSIMLSIQDVVENKLR